MEPNKVDKTYTVRFVYSGVSRLVEEAMARHNAEGKLLLVGREVTRGVEATGATKAYRMDRIEGEVEVLEVNDAVQRDD